MNKHYISISIVAFAGLLSSCCIKQQSTLDLLTGGDVKLWGGKGMQKKKLSPIISFDKTTSKFINHDDNLDTLYLDFTEYLVKGETFKIEDNKIHLSYIHENDTVQGETIEIVHLSKKKLILRHYSVYTSSYWTETYVHIPIDLRKVENKKYIFLRTKSEREMQKRYKQNFHKQN